MVLASPPISVHSYPSVIRPYDCKRLPALSSSPFNLVSVGPHTVSKFRSLSSHFLCLQEIRNIYLIPQQSHYNGNADSGLYNSLTDVCSPTSDHVFAPHQRFAPSSIEYSAHINGFLTTHEDGKCLQAWPVRRFWAGVSLARGESELVGLATSLFHPTVLCGYADGTLLAFNPLRGYMGTRTRDAQPQQKIWKHEWDRCRQAGQKQADSDPGICRLTEGYKVEYVLLNPGIHTSSQRVWRPTGNDEVAPMSTIHENESAVRVVSWNPNFSWGGWAASGTGSGLVRVEDLAI